jgi:hypothetical protein
MESIIKNYSKARKDKSKKPQCTQTLVHCILQEKK